MKNNNPIRRILNAVLTPLRLGANALASRLLASLIRRSNLAAVVAITAITSASAQTQLYSHISPKADQVFHINLKAITAKVIWDEFTSFPFLTKGKDAEKYMYILKDPSLAGIDVHKDIIVSITTDTATQKAAITTFMIPLTDSGKFVTFFQKQSPGFQYSNHPGKGRTATHGSTAIAWNSNLMVVTNIVGDTSARIECLSALVGYQNSQYTTNPLFTKDFADGADFHMWTKQGQGLQQVINKIAKLPPSSPASASHILTSLRFETGKIVMESKTEIAPEYAETVKQFSSRPADLNLIKRIPRGELIGLINIHLGIESMISFMDRFGTRGKLDSMLNQAGLSLNDIKAAFKGDFLLTALMPGEAPAGPVDTLSAKPPIGGPSVYFVTTINDTAAYRKLATKINMSGDTANLGKLKTAQSMRDGLLVISGSKAAVNAYFSNVQQRDISFLPSILTESPVGVFVDFKVVSGLAKAMIPPGQHGKKSPFDALAAFDKLAISSGLFKDNTSQTKVEVTLLNKTDNSFKTLIALLQQR